MSKFRSDFSEYSKNSYKDFIYNQNFNKLGIDLSGSDKVIFYKKKSYIKYDIDGE